MMKLQYADLLSGDSINIDKVGHVRSPYLYELKPSGIGSLNYTLFLHLLAWDKEEFLQYAKATMVRGLGAFENATQLEYFDIVTLIPVTRTLLGESLSFFITEDLIWDDKKRGFITMSGDKEIGLIDRNNFREVANAILQLNYIGLNKENSPAKYSSKKAQEQWTKVQNYLKEQSKKHDKDNSEYEIGNIISKLCTVHNSYNLLNVYNLTVFQLYDQFFQYSYLRGVSLNERIFTIHGGDNFKMEEWLKKIN